jgi:dynamin 1-like protein
MEDLIPIINKLQDVFSTVGTNLIDLPQIIVVGCQSSGKSSVLESIVGRDFLPRGSGIVTRRPLILQLVHLDVAPDDGSPQEYGEFAHKPGEIFTDFEKIDQEIVAETDRVTGTGRNVSPDPIRLKLWSPNVLNLTLVDLPGLTKVHVEGQPANIVQEIHSMVKAFAQKPDSLILAVTPANQDIANSDSLMLAREVDPKGDRTIGVITKVDLMDAGTNAREVLLNQVYPLKLGYIGVVNRSQQDINEKKSIEKARADERAYFENHRDYSDLADRCGTKFLSTMLNRLLMEHIKKCMPMLKQRVSTMLEEKERELEGYGSDPNLNAGSLNAFILSTITKYLDIFNNYLQGRTAEGKEIVEKGEIHGGKIPVIFNNEFAQELDDLPGLSNLDAKNLYMMMKNHTGINVPLFTPNGSFDCVIAYAIEQLREPCIKLVDKVAEIIFDIHSEVKFMELERFTALDGAMRAVCDECVRNCVEPCKQYISDLIDSEKDFINTARPDFRGEEKMYARRSADIRSRPVPVRPAEPDPVAVCTIFGSANQYTQHQGDQMNDLKQIGQDYFNIIREQIKQIVPKVVVHLLISKSTEMLRPAMIKDVFNSASIGELAQEDPSITKKRIGCKAIVMALRRAQEILLEVRSVKF